MDEKTDYFLIKNDVFHGNQFHASTTRDAEIPITIWATTNHRQLVKGEMLDPPLAPKIDFAKLKGVIWGTQKWYATSWQFWTTFPFSQFWLKIGYRGVFHSQILI